MSPTTLVKWKIMGLQVRNTMSIGMRPFGEIQRKAMRDYAQSGQYYTIVGSLDF